VSVRTAALSSDATRLTVRGTGFDNYNQSNNLLDIRVKGRKLTELVSSEKEPTSFVAVSVPTRTHLVLTFCWSALPPSIASEYCSLQLTDNGVRPTVAVSYRDVLHQNSSAVEVASIAATSPCTMRKRGGYHPCNSKGSYFDVMNQVVGAAKTKGAALPVDKWVCQCDCNQTNPQNVIIGRYCELSLTAKETSCFYRCKYTPHCNKAFWAWQSSFAYSSYPNPRTQDVAAYYRAMMHEAMGLQPGMTLADRAGASSIFMCMDIAQGVNKSVVALKRPNVGGAPEIASGAGRRSPSFVTWLAQGAAALALHVLMAQQQPATLF
jgi:hypothetical protein